MAKRMSLIRVSMCLGCGASILDMRSSRMVRYYATGSIP